MARTELKWLSVDVSELGAEERKAYTVYETAKGAFEAQMAKGAIASGMMTEDQRLVFTYRRGLAVAIDSKKAEAGKWPVAAKAPASPKTPKGKETVA